MSTNIVFMGTPDFAVPVLRALVEAGHHVCAVVTQPDRPVGRKRLLTPSPVKVAAQALGIPVLQPVKVRAKQPLDEIAAYQPDVIVTAAYGQILPQALLDIPRVGCLNVHASLLPRWRGAAPIHRAIMAGDEVTGVTLMEMVLALDAGPMLASVQVPIELTDNVGTLHDKLASAGADLLVSVLPDYVSGSIELVAQSEDGVTYAERITREDEFVRFDADTRSVYNHIRGLSPWPGATACVNGSPVKIHTVRLIDQNFMDLKAEHVVPGGVRIREDGQVMVRCQDGWLGLEEVQPAGKRKMHARDWVRGMHNSEIRFEMKGSMS